MPPHVKNERARLLRRMEQLLDHFATFDPDGVTEFRLARDNVKTWEARDDERYLGFRGTKDAVTACLNFERKRMTKRVIADKLFRGGFPMDPEAGQRLVVESITKNIQRGHYDIDDDGLVGMPEWNGKDPL